MSLLFVDSGCDLDDATIKRLGIEIIRLPYALNDVRHEFDDNFDYQKFYSKIKKGICLSSIEPTTEEYCNYFRNAFEQGNDIVYIHASREIFKLENLYKAQESLAVSFPDRKLKLVDSGSFSIGQAALSYECALLYRKGASVDEIIEHANKVKHEYDCYFTIDSTEFLYNHGLVDANDVSGTALNIKPLLTTNFDGKIEIIEKLSGRKKVLNKLISLIRQKGENIADNNIYLLSTNQTETEQIREKLLEAFEIDLTIEVCKPSPTTSSLLGSNAFGICFHVHKKKS